MVSAKDGCTATTDGKRRRIASGTFEQQAGNIEEREMLTTFNCGIGFLIIVPADAVEDALSTLQAQGETPVTIGTIVPVQTNPTTSQILVR